MDGGEDAFAIMAHEPNNPWEPRATIVGRFFGGCVKGGWCRLSLLPAQTTTATTWAEEAGVGQRKPQGRGSWRVRRTSQRAQGNPAHTESLLNASPQAGVQPQCCSALPASQGPT